MRVTHTLVLVWRVQDALQSTQLSKHTEARKMARTATVVVRGTDAAARVTGAMMNTRTKFVGSREDMSTKPASAWLFSITGTPAPHFEDVLSTHVVVRANMVLMQYKG